MQQWQDPNTYYYQDNTPKLARWLMAKGLAKNAKDAQQKLLIIALIGIVASGYFFFQATQPKTHKPSFDPNTETSDWQDMGTY